jgi:hypothetical protein
MVRFLNLRDAATPSSSATLFLELAWLDLLWLLVFLLIFVKPLAEFFVNGLGNLNEAALHPVQIFVKPGAKDFIDRHETEIGQ